MTAQALQQRVAVLVLVTAVFVVGDTATERAPLLDLRSQMTGRCARHTAGFHSGFVLGPLTRHRRELHGGIDRDWQREWPLERLDALEWFYQGAAGPRRGHERDRPNHDVS